MTIGYRAILSAERSNENLDRIVDVLESWVVGKKEFHTLPPAGESIQNPSGAQLVGNEIRESSRGVSGFRWTLSEHWEPPKWYKNTATSRLGVTQINLVFVDEAMWLWVDVEPPTLEYVDSDGRQRLEAQPSGTPSFVSDILGSVEMHDGVARPGSAMPVIDTAAASRHLREVLQDSSRRGSVYVTSPPDGVSEKEWISTVEKILGRIEGMGFGYVLSVSERNAFNESVESGHRIPSGSIRTFLPGADLSDGKDALRHRILHSGTIRSSNTKRLQRIIRNAQIGQLRSAGLPAILREADYAFLRQQSLRTFEVLHSPAGEQVVSGASENGSQDLMGRLSDAEEMVNEVLRDNEVLRVSADEQRGAAEALRNENEELYLDLTLLRQRSESDRRQISYLQGMLSDMGGSGAAAAHSFVDSDAGADHPVTFADFVDRIRGLPGVRYFGNVADAEYLDEQSDLGACALMKAWDAVVTFNAYAIAKIQGEYDKSLSQYVTHADHGFPMRISRVKWSEGETVRSNSKMKAQRTIRGLPEEIAQGGSKLLVAHIALATGRAGSPRLYFEDAVDKVGYVMIGYIGPHLDNTLTN